MPFVPEKRSQLTIVTPQTFSVARRPGDPTTGEIFGAAFRRDNLLFSAWQGLYNFATADQRIDPNYDVWNDIKGTKYESAWKIFARSGNARYTAALKAQYDREMADRDILARGGAMAMGATLIANLADPTMLIPVGGQVVKGARGVYTILKAGARTAAAGGVSTAVQEAGLHATQVTRTFQESAISVSASVVLSGLLGSSITYLSRNAINQASGGIPPITPSAGPNGLDPPPAFGPLNLSDLSVDGVAANELARITQKLSPNLRLNFSESVVARETGQQLSENATIQTMHAQGRSLGPAVSRFATIRQNDLTARTVTAIDDNYAEMRKLGGQLTRDDFNEAVSTAMRKGDRAPDAHVAQAALALRKVIVELNDDAARLGLLHPQAGEQMAESLLPRLFRQKMLIEQEGQIKPVWYQDVHNWADGQYRQSATRYLNEERALDAEEARLRVAEAQAGGGSRSRRPASPAGGPRPTRKFAAKYAALTRKRDALRSDFRTLWEIRSGAGRLDPFDAATAPNLRDMAERFVDRNYEVLTGRDYGASTSVAPSFQTPVRVGGLEANALPVSDDVLVRQGVLETDASEIVSRYIRTMAADIELTRRFGDPMMTSVLAKISADHALLRQGVTDQRELRRLKAREEADLRDIEAVRDLVRGTYKAVENASTFGRVVRTLGHYDFVRKLGGTVESALSTIYRPAMTHGLSAYMADGLIPLMRNGRGIQLSLAEAKLAGLVLDRVLAQRMSSLSSLADEMAAGTPIERLIENMARGGTRWSGITLWNDAIKGMTSILSQNMILAGKLDARKLAFLGIDANMAKTIRRQFASHGETIDGVLVARTERWTNAEAVRVFRAAVAKDVDMTNVTPGVGDLPLFIHTPLGKLIAEFRSVALASHQQVLLRGMQEGRARFISGMVGMSTLGMLTAYLKARGEGDAAFHEFQEKARNPGFLIGEGLDNSGMFALAFDLANTAEKVSGGYAGSAFNPFKTPLEMAGARVSPGATGVDRGRPTPPEDDLSRIGPAGALAGSVVGMFADDLPVAIQGAVNEWRGSPATLGEKQAWQKLVPAASFYGLREIAQTLNGDLPYGHSHGDDALGFPWQAGGYDSSRPRSAGAPAKRGTAAR
ncbi:hypothetical protein [Sphingomonas rustica]